MLRPRTKANPELNRHADRLDVLFEFYKKNPGLATTRIHQELSKHKRTIDALLENNPAKWISKTWQQ